MGRQGKPAKGHMAQEQAAYCKTLAHATVLTAKSDQSGRKVPVPAHALPRAALVVAALVSVFATVAAALAAALLVECLLCLESLVHTTLRFVVTFVMGLPVPT